MAGELLLLLYLIYAVFQQMLDNIYFSDKNIKGNRLDYETEKNISERLLLRIAGFWVYLSVLV